MNKSVITLEGLKGVGSVHLELASDRQVYVLLGGNGIGKTKTLEALFQFLFFTHKVMASPDLHSAFYIDKEIFVFSSAVFLGNELYIESGAIRPRDFIKRNEKLIHDKPVVFLASQSRGFIKHKKSTESKIGTFAQRRAHYLKNVVTGMKSSFTSLNMDIDVEEWFVTRAQSSNRYQRQEDSREVELEEVLTILHEIEPEIDSRFLEISGDGRVSIKINGQKRELSHLSTGFSSILKMIQSIVSVYGYYTNEVNLRRIPGIVLIDEIESHLHVRWQVRIVPILKRLFPNTKFIITTHSPIVLTQLEEQEAYRLKRGEGAGIVHAEEIRAPGKAALVDILNDAFDIDLNKLKRERMSAVQQQAAKDRLLALLEDDEAQE